MVQAAAPQSSGANNVLHAAFSTLSLPGIFSNVANKFVLKGFMGVEDVWRRIASIRSVKDFKTITSYRLTGDMVYDQVSPDGELKHGKLGEESFTNKADTFGKMFSITRQDIINDDAGALTVVPRRIGRGHHLKINNVFWAEFKDNADFFKADNKNYMSGAGTILDIDSLSLAEKMFFDLKDPDDQPLSINPTTLLVPNALNVNAANLMNSTELRPTGATSRKVMTKNPHAGKFTPIRSSYLNDSATAWYLLASPDDLPLIEIVFLNGKQTPTVETAQADFNTLGIQMRGYGDFGVSKQEFRAGVKSLGDG